MKRWKRSLRSTLSVGILGKRNEWLFDVGRAAQGEAGPEFLRQVR